jgi:hypothetical protein
MPAKETRSSGGKSVRPQRTLVLDTRFPAFKRTLSKQPGGLGAGVPHKVVGSRKSALAKVSDSAGAATSLSRRPTAGKQGVAKGIYRGR